MFEAVGKIVAIIFLITVVLIALAFGLGWLTVAFLPAIVIAVPIALVAFLVYKVIKA